MNKTLKTIIIVLASLASIAIIILVAFYILVYSIEKEDDKLVEQYEGKTIDVLSVDEMDKYFSIDSDLKASIVECKAYFTPTTIVLTMAKCYHGSGKLIVTENYYNKLLNEYDDWKLISGFPQTDYFGYSESNILEYADDDFKNFVQSKEYFYSENLLRSKGKLMILSKEKGKIYFFVNEY